MDFLIDTTGTEITSLIRLGELYGNLEDAFQKPIDVITARSLQDPASSVETKFRETVMRERIRIGGVVWLNENGAYASSNISANLRQINELSEVYLMSCLKRAQKCSNTHKLMD